MTGMESVAAVSAAGVIVLFLVWMWNGRRKPVMIGGWVLFMALLLSVSPLLHASAVSLDDPGGFYNIMPPGQDGTVNTAEMAAYQLGKHYPKHANDLGHRRDFSPKDGKYDHETAVAIGDALFPYLVKAMFGKALEGTDLPNVLEDSPRQGVGSAYIEGYYSYVQKDLRQVLDAPVRDSWHTAYCEGGDMQKCRAVLWKAMEQAASDLEKEYGSKEVQDWMYDGSRDTIHQKAVGLMEAPQMQWVNRPTFQQVVQVGVRP
jgi:hypothetical protein